MVHVAVLAGGWRGEERGQFIKILVWIQVQAGGQPDNHY